MNGGYAMIDCSGVDLGTLGTVTGIYTKAKQAIESGKPMVLDGVVNGDYEFSPIPCYGTIESTTSVSIAFYPVTIHISSDDEITM